MRSVPEVEEYRVEISRRGALTEVEVQIEVATEGAAEKLATGFAAAFSLRIPVTRVAHASAQIRIESATLGGA